MDAMAAYVAGRRDPDVLDGLAQELADIMDGAPWPARGQLRRQLRDELLRQAGALIAEPKPWTRAGILAERARCFELRKWPAWRLRESVPARADAIESLLWRARHYDEVMLDQRTMHRILL